MYKAVKSIALTAAKWLGLFAIARRLTSGGVRILCYHGVWLGRPGRSPDSMFISADKFARRLELLKRHGHPVVSLTDAVDGLAGRSTLPPAAVVITIDDGWYGTFRAMLPPLAAHAMPATLYVDTAQFLQAEPLGHVMAMCYRKAVAPEAITTTAAADYATATDRSRPNTERLAAAHRFGTSLGIDVDRDLRERAFAYMTPDELRQARAAGIDIELHTHNHSLGDMSDAVVEREIADNRAALAGLLGVPPSTFRHFCYPSGVTSPGAARTLARLGLASATTCDNRLAYPGDNPHLLPRFLDGENVTDIEFEAELSGFSHLARALVQRLRGRGRAADSPTLAPAE